MLRAAAALALLLGIGSTVRAGPEASGDAPLPRSAITLEELAFFYRTDKSRDDHKYSDVYSTLFDPLRDSVVNVTEVGIFTGSSIQMWHDYFHNAQIHGFDIKMLPSTAPLHKLERVHLHKADCQSPAALERVGFSESSMDVIIDDGDHNPDGQQETLRRMWRYLKPGGTYVIEDVMTGGPKGMLDQQLDPAWRGRSSLVHMPANLTSYTRAIFSEHDVFFVDPLVGHRALHILMAVPRTRRFLRDRLHSNTHMVIIRKRLQPRSTYARVHTARSGMMKSARLQPQLDLSDVRAAKQRIHRYLSAAACKRPGYCGAGVLNCGDVEERWRCLGAADKGAAPWNCAVPCFSEGGAV